MASCASLTASVPALLSPRSLGCCLITRAGAFNFSLLIADDGNALLAFFTGMGFGLELDARLKTDGPGGIRGGVVLEGYPLEVVDMADVAGETDTYMNVVVADTTDTCVAVVATHSTEASGCMTNTVRLQKVKQESLVGCLQSLAALLPSPGLALQLT